MKRFALPALCASSLAISCVIMSPANADERWMSEGRMIEWWKNKGSTAVFKMNSVYFYIEDLASETSSSNRGYYTGYWVSEGFSVFPKCSTFRELDEGKSSYNWGRFNINFIGNSYPYKWKAKYGECDRTPIYQIKAKPITGDGLKAPGWGRTFNRMR